MLVEQNTRLALDIAPRAVVMDRGRIVYDGAERNAQGRPGGTRPADRGGAGVKAGFRAADLSGDKLHLPATMRRHGERGYRH